MKIEKITNQIRSDIFGTLKCECCGHEQKFTGYDDEYYHSRVVPKIKCQNCGSSSAEPASVAAA